MAVTPNATTTTSVTEVINSQEIMDLILQVHREATIADMIGWFKDASGSNTGQIAYPKADDITLAFTEASPKPETDEIAASEQTYTEVLINAATVATRRAISDEAQQDSIPDQTAFAVKQNMLKLLDQRDIDLLLNITSGTETGGIFTGLVLTADRFGAALAAARKLNFTGSMLQSTLSHSQIRDLTADLRSTAGAIFGGALGDQTVDVLFNAQKRGRLGMYEGVEMFQTSNVPAFDGSNDAGAIFSGGEGGALAISMWKDPTPEAEREAKRLQVDVVTSARWGTGLVDDENLIRVVSLD